MIEDSTVFIVDDDHFVRDSLKFLIEAKGYRVECFEQARQMLDRAKQPLAGCLVADIRLGGMSGLDMHDRLRAMGVSLPTIVITGHGDVSAAVRAFKAGALDFLEKPFSDKVLVGRIDKALTLDRQRREAEAGREYIVSRYEKLTPRARQVMAKVVEGRLNKQIAADLGLSHKTIEVHRAHVMDKMGAKSLAELVRMAVVLEPVDAA